MTIANAFRLPAIAIIASTQATHLEEIHAFQEIESTDLAALEIPATTTPHQSDAALAGTALQYVDARQSAGEDFAATDIWERLRAGFGMSGGDKMSIQPQLDRFRKQAYFVEQILQRSEPYLFHILTRVEARGLPTELALLPVIESAFDPFARSPAGAAGIWQFMPDTASEAGLQQDWWYDGRRDIVAATEAALDHLTALLERYGDWQLALAAYNAGSARVSGAMRSNRREGRPVGFRHLSLPEETRNYVPKLLALRAIIADPAAHGITLPALADARYFTSVDTGGQIDLQVAARLTGASLDELQRLNPGLMRSITPPGGSHSLLVPSACAQHFRARLALLPAEQRVQSVRYRVRPGDTLSEIALHSRTTVSRLRKLNQLESSRIVAGSVLIVPVADREQVVNVSLQDLVESG
jgi:membrane-bound lytic murein transglycosylase D